MYETSASPGSMQDTGCVGLVHWDDPEGWNGEGGCRQILGMSEPPGEIHRPPLPSPQAELFLDDGVSELKSATP